MGAVGTLPLGMTICTGSEFPDWGHQLTSELWIKVIEWLEK